MCLIIAFIVLRNDEANAFCGWKTHGIAINQTNAMDDGRTDGQWGGCGGMGFCPKATTITAHTKIVKRFGKRPCFVPLPST